MSARHSLKHKRAQVPIPPALAMLRLCFHTNHMHIFHLIFAHDLADDACNTIASHLSPCLSLEDLCSLLQSKQIRFSHLKSLRPSVSLSSHQEIRSVCAKIT